MPVPKFRSGHLLFYLFAACTFSSALAGEPSLKKDTRPPVDPTKDRTLYAVGYAHLDTQWRWTYPQVIREFVGNTLHQNFPLFEKYPNYIFNFSGSRRYEMMKEYYPEEYQKLKGYVAAGRWFPCGSSVDESDAIVPSLESMIRHVLYGNQFFKREFNLTSQEFMLPDCFGFPASLPTILSHCGIIGFSTQKLTWGSANGIPFKVGNWVGPDGSRVVAALDPGAYTGEVKEDLSQSESWLQRINKTGTTSGAYVDYHYYGTGDRGGAPGEKSVQWIERSIAGTGPVHVVSSNAEAMFKVLTPAQKEKLPTYQGDLLLTNHSAGSITSQAYMKRWNRKSELLADSAERAAVAAMSIDGTQYPSKKLYGAWDLVLGSQMHDMLPGTSLPKAYEYCWNDYLLAQNQFAAVLADSVTSVSAAMDTSAQGVPLVVYNPLSIVRDDLVEADVAFPGDAPEAVQVFGPDGKETPAQVNHRQGKRAKVVFLAHVPAIGFGAYDVRPAAAAASKSLQVSDSARMLENDRYKVTINNAGDIASIFDKTLSKELLAAPARLSFQDEDPEQYPAWNMDWADRQKPSRSYVGGPCKVRVVEAGPARVALEVERESEGSLFVQQIRLGAGAAGDRVEVVNRIDWQTRGVSLKAGFPMAVSNNVATYDDKIGTVARGNNEPKQFEVPLHHWFDLTDSSGTYGVAVLNDCKYGADKPNDNTVRLTLLYTPKVHGGYQDQASQDLGRHAITYAIAGHVGSWEKAGVQWQGLRLNQPLVAFQSASHEGKLGKSYGLFAASSEQVEVEALKKAEESKEMVIRLRELTGHPAKQVRLSAFGKIRSAREIDGQERPIGAANLQNGDLVVDLAGYGLRAFAITLQEPTQPNGLADSRPVDLNYDLDAVSAGSDRTDGGFDTERRTYPAELFPAELVSEGVSFRLGSAEKGQKNALVCRGQSIALPAGEYNRIYFLAASSEGDTPGIFTVGNTKFERNIQDWGRYIGQWDNRLWEGKVPELAYDMTNLLNGLVPGFVKPATVAWYASHRNHPQNGTEYYQYCYLFKYDLAIEPGTKTLKLPDNDKIRIFAATVVKDTRANAQPVQALYDSLQDRSLEKVRFSPEPGKFSNTTKVALSSLYWKTGCIHYTTDGSKPTADSPVYSKPLPISKKTLLRARVILPDGQLSPEGEGNFDVHDITPPKVAKAEAISPAVVYVEFSKPVERHGAENAASYRFEPAVAVKSVQLNAEGTTARLELAKPVSEKHRLTVSKLVDCSPQANPIEAKPLPVSCLKPTFRGESFVCDGNTTHSVDVNDLPQADSPWTINFFVRSDVEPENRTLFAGFGGTADKVGTGRYLAKYGNGIHFYSAWTEGETNAAFETGKWQMLTAMFDGEQLTIFKNGERIGGRPIKLKADDAKVAIAPVDPWDRKHRFKGEIRDFTIWKQPVSVESLQELLKTMPK